MVTIINYKERQTLEGESFFVLEVQGGIEMVKSQNTGNFYATAKKASISSTFDEMTCKALIGTQMSGSIHKEECEPYEYTVKETGEILLLNHRWIYHPNSSQQTLPEDKNNIDFSILGKHEFSRNGSLEPA